MGKNYQDREVVGLDKQGNVVQWHAGEGRPFSTGQKLAEFGLHNLREQELDRVGADRQQWLQATQKERMPEDGKVTEMMFGTDELLQFNVRHAAPGHTVILGPAVLASLRQVGIQATVGILTRMQEDGVWWAQIGDEEWCVGSGYDWRLRDTHLLNDNPAGAGERKLVVNTRYAVEFSNRNGMPQKTEVEADSVFAARKAVAARPDFDSIISCRKVAADVDETQALTLRSQALALLQQAEAIDGLKPFIVTHRHESGSSSYIAWSKNEPNEEQATSVLDSEFEPDLDEWLAIESNITLDELTGVSVSSRVVEQEETTEYDSPSPGM